MDFYSYTSKRLDRLSNTERNIFNFVIKNLHQVKDMSIRTLASECFVSTTTLFRFVKKLGFEGYNDFIAAIRETEADSRRITIPEVVLGKEYQTSYLKNITEAVQVITEEKKETFNQIMSRYPKIYILAQGLSRDVGWYFYRMLTTCGYEVEFPEQEFQFKAILRRVKRDDVLLVLSFTGSNETVIRQIEEIFAIATPTIISITRADNNVIQNMSDVNFYMFADEVQYLDASLTSRCGMIAIFESLMYMRIAKAQKNP